jgi:hypothetical protein
MSQNLARAFVSEAISNSHAGIKACWLIVFSAGTYAALSTMKDVLIQMGWFNTTVPIERRIVLDQPAAVCFVLFVVFVATFLRFYIGGVRVFDIRYSEFFKLVNMEMSENANEAASFQKLFRESEFSRLLSPDATTDSDEIAKLKKALRESDIFRSASAAARNDLSRFKRLVKNSDQSLFKFEVVVLTFQTLIVVFLAFQIGSWLNFTKVYAFLLLWNVIYLSFNYVWSGVVIRPIFEEIFPATRNITSVSSMFPMRASLIWIANNLVCLLILIDVLFFSDPFITERSDLYAAFVCVVLSLNCMFDFTVARDFYFPQFHEFLEVAIPASSSSTESNRDLGVPQP